MPYDEPKSCVFWDLEDFPLPIDVNPDRVFLHTKYFLQDKGYLASSDEFSIKAYVDKDTFATGQEEPYKDAGITILPVQGGKYARADNMLVDIVLWALKNPATCFKPLDLMVISEHVQEGSAFLHVLEALQDRYYNVILVAHDHLTQLSSTKVSVDYWPCLLMYLHLGRDHDWSVRPDPVHKPKFIEETGPFPKRVVSLQPKIIAITNVVVFMDAKGCPTDKDSDLALFIYPAIQDKGYYGHVTVMAYLEDQEPNIYLSPIIQNIARVTKSQNEDAKVTRMLLDMLFWAMNNEERTHFILISKPSTYMYPYLWESVVEALESRGSDVIFAPFDDIELPLSRHTFELLCKASPAGLVHPLRDEVPTDPKLLNFSLANHIGIFWVVDEFPSDPMIVNFIFVSMQATMEKKGYFGSVTLMAYVNDIELMRVPTIHRLRISYLPEGNRYVKVTRIMEDMFFCARNSEKGSTLIVVSEPFKDAKFDSFCESLRDHGFNVFQTHLDYMVTVGTPAWSARRKVASYCQCDMCLATIGMTPSV